VYHEDSNSQIKTEFDGIEMLIKDIDNEADIQFSKDKEKDKKDKDEKEKAKSKQIFC